MLITSPLGFPSLFILAYQVVRDYRLSLPSYIPALQPCEMAREHGEYPYYIETLKKLHLTKFTINGLTWKACVAGDLNLLIYIRNNYNQDDHIDKILADLIWHLHVNSFIMFHRYLGYPKLSYECMTACAFPRRLMYANKEDIDERVSALLTYLTDHGVVTNERTDRLASFCGNISYLTYIMSDEQLNVFQPIKLDVLIENALSKGHLECALLLGSDGSGLKCGYSIVGGVASMLLRLRESNLENYNIALGFLDF